MPGPHVQEWIERQMAAGVPRDGIRKALVARGWPEPQIEQALNLLGAHDEPGKHQQPLPLPEDRGKALRTVIMAAMALVFLIVGAVAIYVFWVR